MNVVRHLIVIIAVCNLSVYAQPNSETQVNDEYYYKVYLQMPIDSIVLPHRYIKISSECVLLDSLKILRRGTDYIINYNTGVLWLKNVNTYIESTSIHVFHIFYRILPITVRKEYQLHTMRLHYDSTVSKDSVSVVSPISSTSDDIFGPGITKSGSIVRGFTVGTNRDMSLTSGFRLQMAGKLSDDIDVVAALTDENTPLQPEGNTQTLREVDKVFVELKHPLYEVTLGDISYEQNKEEAGEFSQIQRKILGAYGRGHQEIPLFSNTQVDAEVVLGTAKGKYTTNQFSGIDGIQGPYRLRGKNGEQYILVIAGSERVYVDGVLMTRGETHDYVIDYANGEIIFTSRRIITSASRIVVDFEYSERAYTRNLMGTSLKGSALDNRITMKVLFRKESDDQNVPVDITLNEYEKKLLRESGNNRYAAAYKSIRFVGLDSITGHSLGQYMLIDTVINNKLYTILHYAPGHPNAFYTATFSPVSQVPPDSAGYIRVGIGNYRFAGLGQGNYMPYQFLPMPQAHQLVDVQGSYRLGDNVYFESEYATSSYDENKFSYLDSAVNGKALRLQVQYSPKNVKVSELTLGSFDVSFIRKYVQSTFIASERFKEVEYDRTWNILSNQKADEIVNELSFTYIPRYGMQGSINYGTLERRNIEKSNRFQSEVSIQDSSLPLLNYKYETISSQSGLVRTQSQWFRHRGRVEYTYHTITPGIQFESEKRIATLFHTDSLLPGSFKLIEIAPTVLYRSSGSFTLGSELRIRREDSTISGAFHKASNALYQAFTWHLKDWNNISLQATVTKRQIEYTELFRKRGNINSTFFVTRMDLSYLHPRRLLDGTFYYEFSNQRSARLERVFVRVPKGMGNYTYSGDLNANGIADESEYQPVRFDGDYIMTTIASEQMYPVADLKSSFRLRVRFSETGIQNTLLSFLRHFTTETYARIEEKSIDPISSNIYLLKLKYFMRPTTTLYGVQQIMQDIYIFEGLREFSVRLRFHEKWGLSQYVSANERTKYSQQSIRIESQLVNEIANRTDFVHTHDQLQANVYSQRTRNIYKDNIKSDFSYRPTTETEVGLSFGFTRSVDKQREYEIEASMNEQSVRVLYSIPSRGQLRTEIIREETIVNNTVNSLVPFELTEGKPNGQGYLWNTSLEYSINAAIQFSLQYQGRMEAARKAIHTFRAEARAFF
ncbi:MAG: hypothetical protein N3A63_00740 [Bacteroidetes bacterium]|nr:hypothetical protein [Bacteroidota bacterium]